ncbi:hypothetical protein G6F57_019306 [Rhizopus arrhizus]|nr:hypothetical protein G6F57_019306 [Rhizopus arrhizus]
MRKPLPGQARAGPQRRRKARAYIVLAIGGHRRIHRQHQRRHPGRRPPGEHGRALRVVARQVSLEPRARGGLHDFLQPDQRRSAHDARHVRVRRRAGQHDVAAVAGQGRNAHRRHTDGRRVFAAQHCRPRAALGHIHQHFGPETKLGERLPVAALGLPVFHRPGHIGVDRLGQSPLRGRLEIMQAEQMAQRIGHGLGLLAAVDQPVQAPPRCCHGNGG